MRRFFSLAIALSTVTALAFAAAPFTTANALQSGENVDFLLKQSVASAPELLNSELIFRRTFSNYLD